MTKIRIRYQLAGSEFWVEPTDIIYVTQPSMQVTQSRRGYMHDN
jgi:hypothetical protein